MCNASARFSFLLCWTVRVLKHLSAARPLVQSIRSSKPCPASSCMVSTTADFEMYNNFKMLERSGDAPHTPVLNSLNLRKPKTRKKQMYFHLMYFLSITKKYFLQIFFTPKVIFCLCCMFYLKLLYALHMNSYLKHQYQITFTFYLTTDPTGRIYPLAHIIHSSGQKTDVQQKCYNLDKGISSISYLVGKVLFLPVKLCEDKSIS